MRALAGCSVTVDGTATTSAGADPPVASRSLTEVLPTGEELSTTLSIGPDGFMGQLVEGGTDTCCAGSATEASPADCVSATYRLQNITYAASPVRSVASRSWTGGDLGGPAFSGFFGVVKLATAGDAEEFFATVAAKWRQCNGKTMVLDRPGRGSDGSSAINSVQTDGRLGRRDARRRAEVGVYSAGPGRTPTASWTSRSRISVRMVATAMPMMPSTCRQSHARQIGR